MVIAISATPLKAKVARHDCGNFHKPTVKHDLSCLPLFVPQRPTGNDLSLGESYSGLTSFASSTAYRTEA